MLTQSQLKIYKEIRQPRYSFYAGTGEVYQHQTDAQTAYEEAIRQDKIERLWSEYEDESVRLLIKPDENATIEDLEGDSFNPLANPDINPRKLAQDKEDFIEKVNRDGVWGIISQVKCTCCDSWLTVDSVWGFIGDDWKGSGYDLDCMQSALEKAGLWETDIS
jgi:hypothetical protein